MTIPVNLPANIQLPTLHQVRAFISHSELERLLGHPPRPAKVKAHYGPIPRMTPAARAHNREQKASARLYRRFVRSGWSA